MGMSDVNKGPSSPLFITYGETINRVQGLVILSEQ
jgi:hypothetical protein